MTDFVEIRYMRVFLCEKCKHIVGVAYDKIPEDNYFQEFCKHIVGIAYDKTPEDNYFQEFCKYCGEFQVAEHAKPA